MPDEVLQRLLEGNRRYVAGMPALDRSPRRRINLVHGQQPVAAILSCVDARVPPELVFDQGLGDLLVVRTAGEVLDRAALGSLEFGVEQLHIPLLVVLGHQNCGAVKVAMDVLGQQGEAEADIGYLVQALAPAVEQANRQGGDLWDGAVRAQVALLVERLKRSPVFVPAVEAGALKIVGAWYSLETGFVSVIVE